MANDFFWNFNNGPGYNAYNDPSYYQAMEKWRNDQLEAREKEAEALLQKKNDNLKSNQNKINSSFDSTFTDNYYKNYADSLMGYWRPDIDRQYGDAQRTLNYSFADLQPGGGSAGAEAMGRLKEAYDKALLSASDNATAQGKQLKGNVESQRSGLLNSVNSDSDTSMVQQQVASTISGIPSKATYSPIGDLFSNLTSQFAVANQANRQGYPGWGFNIGGSGSSSPAVSGSAWKVT